MRNSVLLDTNALLWILDPKGGSLGSAAVDLLTSSAIVYVSAASIFEIQIKSMLGKIKIPNDLLDSIEKSNLRFIDINAEHALSISDFPALKKHDPFDRLLLSQAKQEELVFLTADEYLLGLKNTGIKLVDAKV